MIDKLVLIIPSVLSILFLILVIIISKKNIKEILEGILGTIILSLFCFLLCIVIGFIAKMIILYNANTEFIPVKEQSIYCLNDSSSIGGSKFLFSGTVNERLKYRMFIEENNGKILKEINAEDVTVFEDGNAKLVTLKEKLTNEKVIKWTGYEFAGGIIYQIHIPKDSITTEYMIDLK